MTRKKQAGNSQSICRKGVARLFDRTWQVGHDGFAKTWLVLTDFNPEDRGQLPLLAEATFAQESAKLRQALDRISRKGTGSIWFMRLSQTHNQRQGLVRRQ